jgi:pyrroloquinoline quinone biosynthesis protein D
MIEINETTVMSLTSNAAVQALGEGAVILMLDSGQLYTCNETVEAFLKMLDGRRDVGAIVDLLTKEFAIDRETLARDLLPMAEELRSAGIVQVCVGGTSDA